MPRIDLILLGYFIFTVEKEQLCRASDILLKANVSCTLRSDGRFIISYRDRKRAEESLFGKIEYSVSKPRGIRGFFVNHKNKIGALVGSFLVAFLIAFSSDVVWDVRIEGEIGESEAAILNELSQSGLAVGSKWSKIDTSEVEMRLLSSSKTVSWININRRGSVAYITVGEKIDNQEEEKPVGYANIVASRDCVIEEIIVESGYAMVEKGESVRAGQILISGVYPSEIGGGFCYAEGEVIGRYSDTVSVLSCRKKEEKTYYENELVRVDVKFFNKTVNIFKKYGQSQNNCDIIKKTEQMITKERLPITFIKTYLGHYSVFERTLSESEMIEEASALLEEELLRYLSDKNAKRMKTSGEFLDDGYVMTCYITVSSDITKIQEFDVNWSNNG